MSEENPLTQKFTLKNDRYRKVRGGTAKFMDISCANCGTWILLYQKDGIGKVLRFYLNRIFAPLALASLQHRTNLADVPNLACPSCGAVIGSPFVYDDGRLAYRLKKGTFSKKTSDGTYTPPTNPPEKE